MQPIHLSGSEDNILSSKRSSMQPIDPTQGNQQIHLQDDGEDPHGQLNPCSEMELIYLNFSVGGTRRLLTQPTEAIQ